MWRFAALATAAASAAFILASAVELPATVASNFGAGGRANAFMPRWLFVGLMLVFASALPWSIWLLQSRLVRRGRPRIPNAGHWFAPALRPRTVAFLEAHAALFSMVLTLFMSYTYWLVVAAHAAHPQPAILDTSSFRVALVGFLAFTAVWLAALLVRFRRKA